MKYNVWVSQISGWLFSIIVLTVGILNFFLIHPVPGVVYLLLCFVYVPPANAMLRKRFGFSIPPFVKIMLCIVKSTRGRKSAKELEAELENVQVPEDEILFKKQYYAISDVAKMFGVKASLIRNWENEFDVLEPRKNRKGDRLFKPTDIKNLQIIYDLIRRRKFTLEGAKEYMKDVQKAEEKFALIQSLQKLRGFLLELKAHL
jgi:DNA-binding transcriptional MerR regulator